MVSKVHGAEPVSRLDVHGLDMLSKLSETSKHTYPPLSISSAVSKVRESAIVNPEYRAVLEAVLNDPNTYIRERTRESFRSYLRQFFEHTNKPVSAVTYDDIVGFLTAYTAEFKKRHGGRAPRKGSLNNYKAAIKWFITEAARIDSIPAEMLKLATKVKLAGSADVQAEQAQKATLTFDEYTALCNAADEFHRLLLRTAWETIRRPVEFCSIRWENVHIDDPENLFIYFPQIKVGALRTAAISPELAEMLRQWRRKQESGQAQVQTRWATNGVKLAPSEYVFGIGGAKPIDSTNLGRYLTNLAARIRLGKKISPHCFRGSGAIYYRRVKEWSVEDIQRQGGWNSTEVLVKAYFKDEVHERAKLLRGPAVPSVSAPVTASPKDPAGIAELVKLGVLSRDEARRMLGVEKQ